ncbi:MAG: YajG family lipoprotein [Pontibacterium sp.]
MERRKALMWVKATALAATVIGVAGCGNTLPAQEVSISPYISVSQTLPAHITVEVATQDNRSSTLLGERLDRLKGKAPIFLNDAKPALTQAAYKALTDMGISLFGKGGVKYTILLDSLTYQASYENLMQKVDTSVELRVRVDKNNTFFVGTYNTQQTDFFVSSPSPEENQATLTKILSQSLTRAFNDPKMLDFVR